MARLAIIAADWHPETYGLLNFPAECGVYWLFMGIVHAALFVVGLLVCAIAWLWRRGHFREWISRWALFSLCLYVGSGLVNGLWSCLIFGRLYWSTDYVSDFSPFWPITQGVLDAKFGGEVGGLLGISLLQLQALWLGFAIVAWVSAFVFYKWCRGVISRRVVRKQEGRKFEGGNEGISDSNSIS